MKPLTEVFRVFDKSFLQIEEGRDNHQGKEGGYDEAENYNHGHGSPPLAGLADPGNSQVMEVVGNTCDHWDQAKDSCNGGKDNRS